MISTNNGWKWSVEQLAKQIEDLDATALTIVAHPASGLIAGTPQQALEALATRLKALEDAGG